MCLCATGGECGHVCWVVAQGGHFHICAYWVCATQETPIFSPNFPLQSTAPGLQPAREPARSVLQVSSRDPHFTLEPAPEPRICTFEPTPEPRIFMLDSLQSPLFFTLPWHILTQILGECPPPSRGGGGGSCG